MKNTLERLSKIQAPICISVIAKTHRTHPENEKDSLLLKNLISEAVQRLQRDYDKKTADKYADKLNKLAEKVDYRHNDLGLMLFVSEEISEILKLPISPSSRVIIDKTFATRSIIRALKRSSDYYVLALSRDKARLIEASSDKVVCEFETGGFPASDEGLLKTSKAEGANAGRVSNLTREFFNRIDKLVNNIRRDNPLPVVIYTEAANYSEYLKEADYPDTILGDIEVAFKNVDDKAANLVRKIWPKVEEMTLARHRNRIQELDAAINAGKCVTDLNEVWKAVQDGRGQTVFVEEGFYQPVKNEGGNLIPIAADQVESGKDINDIADEIIEHTLKFGGDVVFTDKDALKDFNRMALITRY